MTISSTTNGRDYPHFHTHRQGRAWTDHDDTGHHHLIIRPWASRPEAAQATYPTNPDQNHNHEFGER